MENNAWIYCQNRLHLDSDLSSDGADRSLLVTDKLLCNPCEEDGSAVPAHGYCTDCSEHLCATCLNHHCTPRGYRKHKLLDKHHMPRTKTYTDECTDKCGIHVGKILECFCEDHQQFVCTLCIITGDHKTCNVGYVPELSKDLFDSEQFKTFEGKLNGLEERSINIETKADENLDDTEKNTETSLNRIRQFRKEINEFFDKLEQNVVEQASEIRQKNKYSIEKVKHQNKQLKKEIEEVQKTITEKKEKRQRCRLFADMKNFAKKLEEFSKKIQRLEESNNIRRDVFSPSSDITKFIEDDSKCFGLFQRIDKFAQIRFNKNEPICSEYFPNDVENDVDVDLDLESYIATDITNVANESVEAISDGVSIRKEPVEHMTYQDRLANELVEPMNYPGNVAKEPDEAMNYQVCSGYLSPFRSIVKMENSIEKSERKNVYSQKRKVKKSSCF